MKKSLLAAIALLIAATCVGCGGRVTTATTAATTTPGTSATAETTTAEPTLLQIVSALDNPYNVALFVNEDPLRYVNVNFELSGPDEGIVEWHPEGDSGNQSTVAATQKTASFGVKTVYGYAATIGPLEPGTPYLYRVRNASGDKSDIWRRYVAPIEHPDSVTFAVFADPQERDQLGYMAFAHGYLSVMAETDAVIDFGLFVGDLVNDYDIRGQWNYFLRYSAAFCFAKPIAATIGNHEHGAVSSDHISALEYDLYTNLPKNGPTYGPFDELAGDLRDSDFDDGKTYSFDYGPAHFVAIDTEMFCDGETDCETFDADNAGLLVDWIAADLAAADAEWTIVFLHRGPYSLSYDSDRVRQMLTPVFDAYGVDLVLSGHDHKYSRSVYLVGVPIAFGRADVYARGTLSLIGDDPDDPDFNDYPASTGVTYLVGNTAGTKFYTDSKSSDVVVHYEFDDDSPVIPIVTVTEDAITVVSYVLLKNSVVDIVPAGVDVLETFRITK